MPLGSQVNIHCSLLIAHCSRLAGWKVDFPKPLSSWTKIEYYGNINSMKIFILFSLLFLANLSSYSAAEDFFCAEQENFETHSPLKKQTSIDFSFVENNMQAHHHPITEKPSTSSNSLYKKRAAKLVWTTDHEDYPALCFLISITTVVFVSALVAQFLAV